MTAISGDVVAFANQIEYEEGFVLGNASCLLFILDRSTPVTRCTMGQEVIRKGLISSKWIDLIDCYCCLIRNKFNGWIPFVHAGFRLNENEKSGSVHYGCSLSSSELEICCIRWVIYTCDYYSRRTVCQKRQKPRESGDDGTSFLPGRYRIGRACSQLMHGPWI